MSNKGTLGLGRGHQLVVYGSLSLADPVAPTTPPPPPPPPPPDPSDVWDPEMVVQGKFLNTFGLNINGTDTASLRTRHDIFRSRSGFNNDYGFNVMAFDGKTPMNGAGGNFSNGNAKRAMGPQYKVIDAFHWMFTTATGTQVDDNRGSSVNGLTAAQVEAIRQKIILQLERVQQIAAGAWDYKLIAMGNTIAGWSRADRRRTLFRICHEFTGSWFGWSPAMPTGAPAFWQTDYGTPFEAAFAAAWDRTCDVIKSRLPAGQEGDFRTVLNAAGNVGEAYYQGVANRVIDAINPDNIDVLSFDHYWIGRAADMTEWNNIWAWLRPKCIALGKPTGMDEGGALWNLKDAFIDNQPARYNGMIQMLNDLYAFHTMPGSPGVSHILWYETNPGQDNVGQRSCAAMFTDRPAPPPDRLAAWIAPGYETTTVTRHGSTWRSNWPNVVIQTDNWYWDPAHAS